MNAFLNTAIAAIALFFASMGQAHAAFIPEPGSLALTGLGLAIAVVVLHKSRRK
jgi:hypothetical protein